MINKMKHIGVFTSGGDAPGMNACIRAVVRSAINSGLKVSGITEGYHGLIEGQIKTLHSNDVSNIIQRGGTILRTARSEAFRTQEGRKLAYEQIVKHELDGIVAIGGDGTFSGAHIFEQEYGVKMIGVPGTIDNDLYGTDWCIGYDTALNTVIQAVDRLRDTADAHNRMFIVEVMGRDAGFLALRSGIASGAEAILIPETPTYMTGLIQKLQKGWERKKTSNIIIVAEGDDFGGAQKVAETIKKNFDKYEIRISILGHIQRGGSPSALDRVLASQLGYEAVQALINGKSGAMVGLVANKIQLTSFSQASKHHQEINKKLIDLAEILAM
jgi:6-phosphofructokinase 1